MSATVLTITRRRREITITLIGYFGVLSGFKPDTIQSRYSRGHSAAGSIMSMGNSSDRIGNRTLDLPAYRAVPQPTVSAEI